MKAIIITVLLSAATFTTCLTMAVAQESQTPQSQEQQAPQSRGNRSSQMQNATPEQRAKMMVQRLSSQLELTSEQTSKIEKIYLDNATRFKRDENTTRETVEKNRSDILADISKVLTPVQIEKHKKMEADRQSNGNRPKRSR